MFKTKINNLPNIPAYKAGIIGYNTDMPIYTKTGDKGTTALFGGKRVSKNDLQVEAYGTVDELSSFLGLLVAKIKSKTDQTFLIEIQADLYKIMAYLASANSPIELLSERVTIFEHKIDSIQSSLPSLHSFILPVGTETSSLCHVVRAVCRRAERNVVALSRNTNLDAKNVASIMQYLNRLSDLFFALSRWYNKKEELKISLLRK
jgi:cob(I)alamin adenosyltransferase